MSIAMRTLRQNNWIDERDVKAEGKGRPMKVYKLSVPIQEIIQHYEEEKNSEAAKTMQAIQRLKEAKTHGIIASEDYIALNYFCAQAQLHKIRCHV